MQTKTDSFMEALTNVAVGFGINFTANVFILPAVLGVPVNLKELGFIGILYTIVSVTRSYTLRRIFNGKSIWQALKGRFGRQHEVVRAEGIYGTLAEKARHDVKLLVTDDRR